MNEMNEGNYNVESAYNGGTPEERAAMNFFTMMKRIFDKNKENVDIVNVLNILPAILELQAQKASVYGRSYCRHGDLSIFFNTERKWDRILNIMEKAIAKGEVNKLYGEGTPTESFFDTVVDLASYSLLWVGYIYENHREVFDKFIEENGLTLS